MIIAETDPQRAATLLSESGIAGRTFDVATVQVIQRWATQSQSRAAAWVALFPPGRGPRSGNQDRCRAVVGTRCQLCSASHLLHFRNALRQKRHLYSSVNTGTTFAVPRKSRTVLPDVSRLQGFKLLERFREVFAGLDARRTKSPRELDAAGYFPMILFTLLTRCFGLF